MPVWLQVTLLLVGFASVVPLFVLANTSNPRAAWRALKEYLMCMGILAAPAGLYLVGSWLMY